MHVFKYAEDFLLDEVHASQYLYYEKHLVFDCDAPKEIQSVINLMKQSKNEYYLDYSCLLFETWLVMHFQDLNLEEDVKKRKIIRLMREYLNITKYTSKVKASQNKLLWYDSYTVSCSELQHWSGRKLFGPP